MELKTELPNTSTIVQPPEPNVRISNKQHHDRSLMATVDGESLEGSDIDLSELENLSGTIGTGNSIEDRIGELERIVDLQSQILKVLLTAYRV